ncbi:MAG: DUF2953 domain-containing protein [Bacillota bacterium]|nr:DUF2953 domain-containing protein [Bacillota bacterium]
MNLAIWIIVIAAIILIACIKVQLRAEGGVGETAVSLRIAPFTFKLSGGKKKKEKKAEAKAKTAKEKEQPEKEKGFTGTLEKVKKFKPLIGETLQLANKILRVFRRQLLFDRLELDLVVATDDAFQTALLYGGICSVLYPVDSIIRQYVRVKKGALSVNADFNLNKTKFDFHLFVSLKVYNIFIIIMAIIVMGLKYYIRNRKQLKSALQR